MEGFRIHKDHKKADAYRWACVKKYMNSRPSNVFVVQRSLRKRGKWVVVKVNSINKSGIKILEVPGINANATSIPPQLREAGRNFNITKYVNIKTGLVGISIVYRAELSQSNYESSVWMGWRLHRNEVWSRCSCWNCSRSRTTWASNCNTRRSINCSYSIYSGGSYRRPRRRYIGKYCH